MAKTKIDWADYSVNPVKGLCPMACSYCYARRMYKRFGWNPEIRYELNVWNEDLNEWPRGSKVFVGSAIDLFHEKTIQYLPDIIEATKFYDHLTFIFLTKQPQNLAKFSPFPDNCWVGVSATNFDQYAWALDGLLSIKASVKFLSFEPLLERIASRTPFDHYTMANFGKQDLSTINWLIIGQQTPTKKETTPKIEWVQEIALAATKARIPLFIKNNLKPLLPNRMPFWCPVSWRENGISMTENRLRQEFPTLESKR